MNRDITCEVDYYIGINDDVFDAFRYFIKNFKPPSIESPINIALKNEYLFKYKCEFKFSTSLTGIDNKGVVNAIVLPADDVRGSGNIDTFELILYVTDQITFKVSIAERLKRVNERNRLFVKSLDVIRSQCVRYCIDSGIDVDVLEDRMWAINCMLEYIFKALHDVFGHGE